VRVTAQRFLSYIVVELHFENVKAKEPLDVKV
jgi:hypothetical protein